MSKTNRIGEFCRVHFRVKCSTEMGQKIAVSGNCFALGNMKKDGVVHLVTTPESHPIWYTADPLVIPRGQVINYRYCLVEGGIVKAFEKVENMREINLDTLDSIIEDEFPLAMIEGFGEDAETELFEQMRTLTRRFSEADKMIWLNAAQRDSRLFLVCYHLPITVKRTKPGSAEPFLVEWSESILARSQSASIADSMKTFWVGTLPLPLKSLAEEEKTFLLNKLHHMDIIPVDIDEDIAAAAYYGFCKQIMWPVFHNVDQLDQIHSAWNLQDDFRNTRSNMPQQGLLSPVGTRSRGGSNAALMALAANASGGRSRSNSSAGVPTDNRVLEWNNLEEEFHLAHEAVNAIFARTLLGLVRPEDVVWVHDYHLMGLPRLLRYTNDKKQRRRASSSGVIEKDSRNNSSATTGANEKIAAAADAALEVPASLQSMRIVFFMHIPFPTSQLFRTLPRAADLLESMICSDVVGFHAFDHARHFLNACKRMLGIRSGSRPGGMLTLAVADREVIVTVSHVSIETDRVGPAAVHPETLRIARELKQKYAGKRIVVGVDVCQRLSGVALKLAAFDKMLSDSSWGRKGNIVLIQKCLRGGTRPGDEETTSNDLRKMVTDINAKYAVSGQSGSSINTIGAASSGVFSPTKSESETNLARQALSSTSSRGSSRSSNMDHLAPADAHRLGSVSQGVIDYEERDSTCELGIHERLALWLVADVFLLTPIREGLNLMPLEYVYVRRDQPNAGAVVVSEFSTCSALLNGSIKVNPFAPLKLADALEKALMLTGRDKELRRQRDLPFISSHPSALWTQQIVNDLEQLRSNSGRGRTNAGMQPTPLQEDEVQRCYDLASETAGICQAASRVFIFDYGGTLLHKEKYDIYIKRQTLSAISGRKPSPEIMSALEKLSNDPLNVVVVITGLTKQKLGDTFFGLKNVTLATSNGLVYSWGQNLLPAPHKKRSKLQHLANAAAAVAKVATVVGVSEATSMQSGEGGKLEDLAGARSGASLSGAALAEKEKETKRELQLGEVTQDLIALSLADTEREWAYYQGNSAIDWQAVSNIALPIIARYTFRTNGTCQSPRIPGIGWSYFGADPEEGHRQAKQLTLELEAALAKFDVKVASLIQSSLEVVPRTLHKGLLVQPLLEKVLARRAGRLPGFLLVVGDEQSDDKMVEVVYKVLGSVPPSAAIRSCKVFTTCVGKRTCPAQFYVNDVEDMEALLSRLAHSPTTAISTPAAVTATTGGVAVPPIPAVAVRTVPEDREGVDSPMTHQIVGAYL